VEQDGKILGAVAVSPGQPGVELGLRAGEESRITIALDQGRIVLNSLSFEGP
jgi:hypothetical protein